MSFSMWNNTKIDEWQTMIDLNIKGILYEVAAILPHIKKQDSEMINVGSAACHVIPAGHGLYSSQEKQLTKIYVKKWLSNIIFKLFL